MASFGLAAADHAPGHAPQQSIPEAWRAYAAVVGGVLPAWLDAPSPAAARLRAQLDALRVSDSSETYDLPLRLWAAADGRITRLETPTLPSGGAEEAGVRGLMLGRQLPQAPPADLRWPIRLVLKITPPPAAAGSTPRQ